MTAVPGEPERLVGGGAPHGADITLGTDEFSPGRTVGTGTGWRLEVVVVPVSDGKRC